ncbi:MAG: hypothetical protein ACXWG7_04045 [Chthoniobacterales bacterium]
MQNEIDIVRDVSAKLELAGIDYLLTGCDADYLETWTKELGLYDLLRECQG